jgi:ribosomal peptide maturation radical SAM protein 1
MDEILHLVARYGIPEVMPVDNILNLDYFKTLLPELKRRRPGIRLFYETKANLKKEQVKLLRDAGVTRIQPGIEAFSSNILRLMHKGVSPLQNVQLLKWCRQHQVDVAWNLLYGFPGENLQDYRDTLAIVKALSHLHPPMAYGWVGLHRFSPIADTPEKFNIRHIRPLKAYQYLYPFPEEILDNLAYFFEFDFDGKEKMERWFYPIKEEVERWQQLAPYCRLEVVPGGTDTMVVRDTRPQRVFSEYHFGNPEKAVIEFCDESRKFSEILAYLGTITNGMATQESWLRNFLDYLVQHHLMLRVDDRYLNLILLQPLPEQAAGAFWTR